MGAIRQIPADFRLMIQRLVPVGLLLSVVWTILEFSKDKPGRAVYPLAFGAYFLFSYFRARRGGAGIPNIPAEYQFYEVYGFFGAWVFIGVTIFVLAVLGIAHIGIAIGTAGLIVAAASGYAIVRETQNMRRRRRIKDCT